jgi:DNA-binding FadR family transcriptional regulator
MGGASSNDGSAKGGVDADAAPTAMRVWNPKKVGSRANAYDQVSEQIRDAILVGELQVGDRLPGEVDLANQFDVSRGTLREALRQLTSNGFLTTTRGVKGGTVVTHPSGQHIQTVIGASLRLLTGSDDSMLESLLEARELLEVPAAGLAAKRHTSEDLDAIRSSLLVERPDLVIEEARESFHVALVRSTGNAALELMLRPIFEVFGSHLKRIAPPESQYLAIEYEHSVIADAIAAGDPEAAGNAMRSHLKTLHVLNKSSWRMDPPIPPQQEEREQ